MRYLITPEFSEKLALLPSSTFPAVRQTLEIVSQAVSREALLNDPSLLALTDGAGLFVYRIGSVRIFLSFSADAEGEYALIADVATKSRSDFGSNPATHSGIAPTRRDPRFEASVNPNRNNVINPNWNNAINPKWNNAINPKWNNAINPNWNNAINPKWNNSINPKWNNAINPKWNNAISPKWNWSLNPVHNPSLNAQFVYDIKVNNQGFIIRANDAVSNVFDMNGEWTKFIVQHVADGFSVFDIYSNYTEHWESNGQNGYNCFTLDNLWIGFVI